MYNSYHPLDPIRIPTRRRAWKRYIVYIAIALLVIIFSLSGLGSALRRNVQGYYTNNLGFSKPLSIEALSSGGQQAQDLEIENKQALAEKTKLAELGCLTDNLLAKENEELKGLLRLQSEYKFKHTVAAISGRFLHQWERKIEIDKGLNSGIHPGDGVFSSKGIVGRVAKVYPESSIIRLFADGITGVGASVEKADAVGIAKYSGKNKYSLLWIDKSFNVAVGDLVSTSGLDKVFPRGIAIGKVSSVRHPDNSLYLELEVEGSNGIDNAHYVSVMSRTREGMPK